MKEFVYQDTKILLGQNKIENHNLITKEDKKYWWFHAKWVPSGHAVVLAEKMTPELIKFAATQVKLGCKEKNNPNAKIEYTKLGNLEIVGVGTVLLPLEGLKSITI